MTKIHDDITQLVRNERENRAISDLFDRDPDGAATLDEFRQRFEYSRLNGCWMATWCRMTVGIESDGYTHT